MIDAIGFAASISDGNREPKIEEHDAGLHPHFSDAETAVVLAAEGLPARGIRADDPFIGGGAPRTCSTSEASLRQPSERDD